MEKGHVHYATATAEPPTDTILLSDTVAALTHHLACLRRSYAAYSLASCKCGIMSHSRSSDTTENKVCITDHGRCSVTLSWQSGLSSPNSTSLTDAARTALALSEAAYVAVPMTTRCLHHQRQHTLHCPLATCTCCVPMGSAWCSAHWLACVPADGPPPRQQQAGTPAEHLPSPLS